MYEKDKLAAYQNKEDYIMIFGIFLEQQKNNE